jgi:hypothetical protein
MKVMTFWYTLPCSLIEVDQHFRSVYCLHYQGNDYCIPECSHLKKNNSVHKTQLLLVVVNMASCARDFCVLGRIVIITYFLWQKKCENYVSKCGTQETSKRF